MSYSLDSKATVTKTPTYSLQTATSSGADQLCCYRNQTPHIQVIRIADLPDRQFERVIFPGQRLMFYAPEQARLQVYASNPVGSLLADTITCDRLRVATTE